MSGLTVEEIVASNPLPSFVVSVLADEERLGHIERTPDGGWRVAPDFAAEHAAALSNLGHMPATKGGHLDARSTATP